MFKFEKLEVWQKAIDFADLIYTASRSFPMDERFGLTTQIRRAAVSIASNIAEGSSRSDPDFAKFIGYAAGFLYEPLRRRRWANARTLSNRRGMRKFTGQPKKSVAC